MASDATLKLLLVGEDRSAGKALRNAGREAESTGEKFKRLGKVAAVGLAGGLVTAGAAMVKFGQQASDLGETQSKVTQIFGKQSSAALEKFADTAGKSLGQSKQQALDAAATFGIIGKSAGKSGADLVKFSTKMTTLAGDLASFNNSTPEEAIEAIGSAMRGEAEPIRKYGVLLDDATLRAEALKLGLIKSVKEGLTPQQKALAAQSSILKQTKTAQGDFARTSDGLANKQRILKAEFTNLTTTLGQKALPVMLDVTNAALDLVEGFEDGTGAGGEIRDVLEDIGDAGKAVKVFFDGIPGPVKKYGAEIAIAAVVTSKLRGLMGPMSLGLSTMATNFRSAETRAAGLRAGLGGLANGARNLAGGGGLALLATSASSTNDNLKTLGTIGGAALLGFSVGGPVGLAVGGGAAALLSLRDAGKSANKALDPGPPANYAESLDLVTGASTKATRALVQQALQGKNLLGTTRALGIEDRELVNAIAKGGSARAKVVRQLRSHKDALDAQIDAANKAASADNRVTALETQAIRALREKNAAIKANIDEVLEEVGALSEQTVKNRQNIAATKDYGKALAALPKSKRVLVEAVGIVPTTRGIATLASKINATPKELRTLIKASGVATTVGEIERVQDKLNLLDGRQVKVGIGVLLTNSAQTSMTNILNQALGIPARAAGGPVTAGQPYIVGEKRPELFVPNQSGTILPRVPTGGGDTDYEQMTKAFIAALTRVPIVQLSDAGRGAYQAGASF